MDDSSLFFEDLITECVKAPRFVERDWLALKVERHLADPGCRFVLVTAEPGAGKTAFLAWSARRRPEWLRYFVRRDSISPLNDGDAASFLLTLGHQLACLHPRLFEPQQLEVVVRQRIRDIRPGGTATGVSIDDLRVSPFYRTALRVMQGVETVSGRLVGLHIGKATLEPRLNTPDVLQYLALLDPAALYRAERPNDLVIVLVDGLDECAEFRGEMSVLDWLDSGPEVPANVRFVLASRPHPRLDLLRARRGGQIRTVALDPIDPHVSADLRAYAGPLLTIPEVQALVAQTAMDAERFLGALVAKADGNFAYVVAYGRALQSAVGQQEVATIEALLRLEVLPAGLGGLYQFFVQLIKRKVQQLGRLEVERPASDDDRYVTAWEGVGQRLLGVLAVARAPVTLEQLMAFGGIRAWPRETLNVLRQFAPFLDGEAGPYRLFHATLAEQITGEQMKHTHPDVWVGPAEWHQRVVRHYRAPAGWSATDWDAVDDYGLLHVAGHLRSLGGADARAVVDLVTAELRLAMRRRFHTDLHFRKLVDAAIEEVRTWPDVPACVSAAVTLALVRWWLRQGAARHPPAVLALMARRGRADEALAQVELMPPSERQFTSFCAVVDHAEPEAIRRLGAAASIDRLVGYALDVPVQGPIGSDIHRDLCLRAAARSLAPHDLERALRLAGLSEREGETRARDAVLAAAVAAEGDPERALTLAARMGPNAHTLLDIAEKATGGNHAEVLRRCLRDAAKLIARAPKHEQLPLRARLARIARPVDQKLAATASARLSRAGLSAQTAKRARKSYDWQNALVTAGEQVHGVDPALGEALVEAACRVEANDSTVGVLEDAARLWAEWGRPDRCRATIDACRAAARGERDARVLATLAGLLSRIDAAAGRALADEAVALLAPPAGESPAHRLGGFDLILGGVVRAFLDWDPERALEVARRITSRSRAAGAPALFPHDRLSAVAVVGLRLADRDPKRADQLLQECLDDAGGEVAFGRQEPDVTRDGLFRPTRDGPPAGIGNMINNVTTFAAHLGNVMNYWTRGRSRRVFRSPAMVARSIEMSPIARGARYSWAAAARQMIELVARAGPEPAGSMAAWLVDPAERAIALAAVACARAEANDPALPAALDEVRRSLDAIPPYVGEADYLAEIDLARTPEGHVLGYLNPVVRARFESALLLPAGATALLRQLIGEAGSWFLDLTFRCEKVFWELHARAQDGDSEAVIGRCRQILASLDTNPDELLSSLVRWAVTVAVVAHDPALAAQAASQIAAPGIAAWAKIDLALAAAGDEEEGCAAVERILEDLRQDGVGAQHLAAAAAYALRRGTWEEATYSRLSDRGRSLARQADHPQARALGLLEMASVSEPAEAVEAGREAHRCIRDIPNRCVGTDLLADVLVYAVWARDSAFIAEVIAATAEAGWATLMAALERAAGELVAAGGAGIVAQLDAAFRGALRVLDERPGRHQQPAHIDGVAAPLSTVVR